MKKLKTRSVSAAAVAAALVVSTLVFGPLPANASSGTSAPEGARQWKTVEVARDGTRVTTRSETEAPVALPDGTFEQESQYTVYVAPPVPAGAVQPLDDQSAGGNDGTASVNAWASLNYTRVSGQVGVVIRANSWKARFTRLDPNATLVRGQLVHRNDSVPVSATQTWNSPLSGNTYSFTPSYAGVNTNQAAGVGIFGTANLRWSIFGQTYTHYAPVVHP